MRQAVFIVYAVTVTLMPALFLIPALGQDTVFSLLAGDAYLYLGIAAHSTPEMFSFDGEAPTNGFHPLWQWVAWSLAQIAGDDMQLMQMVAWLAVALTVVGVLLLGSAIARATGSWLLAGLATPGVYFLFVGQGLGNLAVWNFFSGMEAGLCLAITGVLARQVTLIPPEARSLGGWLAMGVTLGLLVMTRLDEVFVVACMALAWLVWTRHGVIRRIPGVVLMVLPTAVFLGVYLAYNLGYMGLAMPISGAAKGEGALIPNVWVSLASFFSPLIDLRAALTDYDPAHGAIHGAGFRVAELIFPAVAAAGCVLLIWRYYHGNSWAPLVAGMCAAIVVKAGYNLVAVNYWHQAPWYFAFATGTLSLTVALLIAPALGRLRQTVPGAAPLLGVLIAMVGYLQASQAHTDHARGRHSEARAAFWQARSDIDAALAVARPEAKLLEFGDGMLNFALSRPVRHGFVFAGDTGSLAALREGRLLAASHAQGYSLLSSYEYLRWSEAGPDRSSDEIRAFLAGSILNDRVKAELGAFEFEIVHVYAPLDIPFIAFRPRDGG